MKLTRYNLYAVGIFYFIYGVWAYIVFMGEPPASAVGNSLEAGISFFYNIQGTYESVFLMLLPMICVPLFFGNNLSQNRYTGFNKFLITRLGSLKRYIQNIFIKTFVVTFTAVLVWQCLLLLEINFLMSPIRVLRSSRFLKNSLGYVFSQNGYVNLFWFVLLTSIGWAIFICLVLAISLFIKNPYVFWGLGIIVGLLLFLIPALLGGEFNKLFIFPSHFNYAWKSNH
ncbi:hypothetical protein A7K95_09010 [Pediococcus parvulus]|uniref:ABC-2 family transporter protein n=2 Tax=Pediococcus parvulus TaxID=54062 RepID=A0ABX2UED5_9LACO|nr:hypothetical protein [Pediococcus parvulus]OAD63543.1 hypothetical protein A7K95_09010 [Pediococcus parvulus]